MDRNSLVFSQSGSPTFKYHPAALKSTLLPATSEDDRLVSRSRKRQKLHTNGASTDTTAPNDDSEYDIVLETSKERFLVVRHGKETQPTGTEGMSEAAPGKPAFTISLILGEIVSGGGAPTSSQVTTTKLGDLTPVLEEPGSPLPAPEQPTKEPSPVEPLPPVSTPQEVKVVAQDLDRERSTSVVDMELDTPASVTPTATAGPDIPSSGKALLGGGEPQRHQDPAPQDAKLATSGKKSQPEEDVPPTEDVSAKVEVIPSKPPSPPSATDAETARPEVLPLPFASVPQPEEQSSPQVKFKLQILQRDICGEDLVFGDDGLGILSADVDPLDNAKKGWLIEAPRWRTYNGRFSDCIVVG